MTQAKLAILIVALCSQFALAQQSATFHRVGDAFRGPIKYDGHGNVRQKTFETREYDSRRNLIKIVNYRWNAELQKFEPASATYHRITYFQ